MLPSAWLILLAWMVGGVYSLFGPWSLSEVGAMTPSAGTYYTIARRAYGDYINFLVGWTDWISVCRGAAFISLLAGVQNQLAEILFRAFETNLRTTLVSD